MLIFVYHKPVSGHVLAFYNLAVMHASGTGVLRSCHTATEVGNLPSTTIICVLHCLDVQAYKKSIAIRSESSQNDFGKVLFVKRI